MPVGRAKGISPMKDKNIQHIYQPGYINMKSNTKKPLTMGNRILFIFNKINHMLIHSRFLQLKCNNHSQLISPGIVLLSTQFEDI